MNFTCICIVQVQYGFLTVSSNICHGQFSLKQVFLGTLYFLRVQMQSSFLSLHMHTLDVLKHCLGKKTFRDVTEFREEDDDAG